MNVAVTKVMTKDDYKQHLPETRKQVGNCPCCNQAAHNYSRKFPFGTADWPSTRLDVCPQFVAKNPRERGELLEKLKGCYKCLSWKHKGDSCYTKSKSNCTVTTSGTACAGIHHKLLHGSGVAFCHKVQIKVAATTLLTTEDGAMEDDLSKPPDLSQPVLLEMQNIKVYGLGCNVMWDKGSTAVIMTHSFAERAGYKDQGFHTGW